MPKETSLDSAATTTTTTMATARTPSNHHRKTLSSVPESVLANLRKLNVGVMSMTTSRTSPPRVTMKTMTDMSSGVEVSHDDQFERKAVTLPTPDSPSSRPSARRRTAARATRLNILAQVNDPPWTASTEAEEPQQPQPHSILNTCGRLWQRLQVCTTSDLWKTFAA